MYTVYIYIYMYPIDSINIIKLLYNTVDHTTVDVYIKSYPFVIPLLYTIAIPNKIFGLGHRLLP